MILRNQVEWALHCCSILSALPPQQTISTKDLAEFHGIPKEYLSKALQALAQAQLVVGTLGPTGGYRLARPAVEITFLDIVEAVEGKIQSFACTEIRKNNPCTKKSDKFSGVCAVAKVMYRADDAYRRELRSMNLQMLAEELLETIPKEQLERNMDWLAKRRE